MKVGAALNHVTGGSAANSADDCLARTKDPGMIQIESGGMVATQLRSTTSDPQHRRTPQEALRGVRARRELLAIEESEQVLDAERAGMTQRQIASELGRSQTDVHRLLRKARAGLPSEARRLILQAVAGEISRGTMVGRLKSHMVEGVEAPGEQVDGYEPGELDEVRRAFMDGLISESEYNEIRGVALKVAP